MSLRNNNVWFCNVPFDNTYSNLVTFSNKAEQVHTFTSGVYFATLKLANLSYIRQNYILVEVEKEGLNGCNYLVYRNNDDMSPIANVIYYYCFITSKEYINDNTTKVFFEVDYFQTYQFYINIKSGFVERGHIPKSQDIIGSNLLGEPLPEAPTVTILYNDVSLGAPYVVVVSKGNLENPQTDKVPEIGITYTGKTITSFWYRAFHINFGQTALQQYLNNINQTNWSDYVVGLISIPESLLPDEFFQSGGGINGEYIIGDLKDIEITIHRPNSLHNGYTPRNNKLLTYPYSYFEVDNSVGTANKYMYEFFDTPNNCKIECKSMLSPNISIYAYPLNYKGIAKNIQEKIILSGYPMYDWVSDPWKAFNARSIDFLNTQNIMTQINNSMGFVSGALQASYGNPSGISQALNSSLNNISQIINYQQTIYNAKHITPTIISGGTPNTQLGNGDFTYYIYQKSITEDFLKIYDMYFDKFGYNTMKIQYNIFVGDGNTTSGYVMSRSSWNYIKAYDCDVTFVANKGVTPDNTAMLTISNALANGTTFWHTTDVGNYDKSNN